MTNPFDLNFFKFFAGFVCILLCSFGIFYFAGLYSDSSAQGSVISSDTP